MNDGSWAIVIQSQENDFVIQREFDLTAGGEATAVIVTVRTRMSGCFPTPLVHRLTHEDHPNCDRWSHKYASGDQYVDNPFLHTLEVLTLSQLRPSGTPRRRPNMPIQRS